MSPSPDRTPSQSALSFSRREFIGSLVLGAAGVTALRPAAAAPPQRAGADTMTEADFIDARWIEHTYFLSRKLTQPERIPEPVIGPTPASAYGTVLPTADGLAMWYLAPYRRKGNEGPLYKKCVHYAVSKDGIAFDKPDLGLRTHEGSDEKNIILTQNEVDAQGHALNGAGGCSGFCVLDSTLVHVPHARGRYTAFYGAAPPGCGGGFCLAHSDDGLHWTAYPENPVRVGSSDTYNNMFYDDRSKRYVAYIRPTVHAGWSRVNREVGRVESEDMIHWGNDRVVLDTDERDAPGARDDAPKTSPRGRARQFYGMTVKPHQDIYLGFPQILEDESGLMWAELAHSYDGLDWRRETLREPFIPIGAEGTWDCAMIGYTHAGCPIAVGDWWYVYYSGLNWDHHFRVRGLKERGRLRLIGAVRLKRGRLVGYHAGKCEGDLLTRRFKLDGSALFVNADASRGQIVAAVCDERGKPLPGLSREECTPIRGDGLRLPVQFERGKSLRELAGREVRLRIYLTSAAAFGLAFG